MFCYWLHTLVCWQICAVCHISGNKKFSKILLFQSYSCSKETTLPWILLIVILTFVFLKGFVPEGSILWLLLQHWCRCDAHQPTDPKTPHRAKQVVFPFISMLWNLPQYPFCLREWSWIPHVLKPQEHYSPLNANPLRFKNKHGWLPVFPWCIETVCSISHELL